MVKVVKSSTSQNNKRMELHVRVGLSEISTTTNSFATPEFVLVIFINIVFFVGVEL